VSTTTTGVVGRSWRAEISPWGDVAPDGGDGTLRWHVAAEDRWHDPAAEPAVRQRRVGGTPVVETRLRVPDGDAVHTVWSVADHAGATVVEVRNESPLPIAVAFSGLPVVTERPVADVPVRGIDLPDDAFVMPVGHRAAVRVAIEHRRSSLTPRALAGLRADAVSVTNGWRRVAEQASRLALPDERLVDDVVAARCDLLLRGPSEVADRAGFVLDVGELVRLGDDPADWLGHLVDPVAMLARQGDGEAAAAVDAAARIAHAAGDRRALADLRALRARLRRSPPDGSFDMVRQGSSAGRFVDAVESALALDGALLPAGVPPRWLGVDFEVHGLPTGAGSTVSFALRWHGERPAVLWEQAGEAITLRSPAIDPAWTTSAPTGEALWAAPPDDVAR
jgi:hypothetical protein